MPKRASRSVRVAPDGTPAKKRLTADARRKSILKAARRAFSEAGDVNGTTMKAIAERGGISEGVIYRHFKSKDHLFYEAVVEPLREAVDELVIAAELVDAEEPLTAKRQVETLHGLYRQLIATLEEVLPLLGLVMFGDPKVARRFYRDHLAVAMDRLGAAWRQVEERQEHHFESANIAARAIMGIALVFALEIHLNDDFDRERALDVVTKLTLEGFFPPAIAESRRP
ncbi:MAG TPA: helix-turn-helix domain-containing protein [Acidimicrobiales bacterium]|nr:helix-turn-helix domain-containing protein [Acidimicrobiales bacterium]